MSEPTLCIECRHHIHISASRRRGSFGHWCYAPWPKTKDFVTGLLEPGRVACEHRNKGDCEHFEPTLLVRFWNRILNYKLFKETS